MTQSTLITSPVQTALVTDANICIAAKDNVLEEVREWLTANGCKMKSASMLTVYVYGLLPQLWIKMDLEESDELKTIQCVDPEFLMKYHS